MEPSMPDSLGQRLGAIERHPFRVKFHLRGRDPGERAYVVDVICRWMQREMTSSPGPG
jgi:hypothetical protein